MRAQISPHFIWSALTAIESYVRSDPERARDLLVGFTEFIRWTFREHIQYATLAEEPRFVDTYLKLDRARFSDPPRGEPASRPGGAARKNSFIGAAATC